MSLGLAEEYPESLHGSELVVEIGLLLLVGGGGEGETGLLLLVGTVMLVL